jgi:hypothetical protein
MTQIYNIKDSFFSQTNLLHYPLQTFSYEFPNEERFAFF